MVDNDFIADSLRLSLNVMIHPTIDVMGDWREKKTKPPACLLASFGA